MTVYVILKVTSIVALWKCTVVLFKGTMLQFRKFFNVTNMTFCTLNIKFSRVSRLGLETQSLSDQDSSQSRNQPRFLKVSKTRLGLEIEI